MSALENEKEDAAAIDLDVTGAFAQRVLVGSLLVVAVSAFALSALPLIDIVHDFAHQPLPIAILTPVVFDAAAVAAAMGALVRKGRGQRATLEISLLVTTVTVSVVAQLTHAFLATDSGVWTMRAVIVALVLGAAPLVVLLSSHAAIRGLVVSPTKKKRAPKPRTKSSPAPENPTPARPATPKPATSGAPRPRPTTGPLPAREAREQGLDYALRLVLDHGVSQRKAAEAANITRSQVETGIKNARKADAA